MSEYAIFLTKVILMTKDIKQNKVLMINILFSYSFSSDSGALVNKNVRL